MRKAFGACCVFCVLSLLAGQAWSQDFESNVSVQHDNYTSMNGGNVVFGDSSDDNTLRTFINTYFSNEVLPAPHTKATDGEVPYVEVPFYSSDELFTDEEVGLSIKKNKVIPQSSGRRVFTNRSTDGKPVRIYTLADKPPLSGNNRKGKTFQFEGAPNGLLETTVELAVSAAYNGYVLKNGKKISGAYPFRVHITVMRQWPSEAISNGAGFGLNGAALPGEFATSTGGGFHRNKSATRDFYIDIVKVYTYNAESVQAGNFSWKDLGMDTIYLFPGMKTLPDSKKILARNIFWMKEKWPQLVANNSSIEILGIANSGVDLALLEGVVKNIAGYTREGLLKLKLNPVDKISYSTRFVGSPSTTDAFSHVGAKAAVVFKIKESDKEKKK